MSTIHISVKNYPFYSPSYILLSDTFKHKKEAGVSKDTAS